MASGDRGTFSARPSLGRVAQQLSHAWFPVNAAVLENVRRRLDEGCYSENRDLLIDDLKADCSLYLLCLRELTVLLRQGAPSEYKSVSNTSFASAVQDAAIEHIKRVLDTPLHRLSAHKLENATPAQAERLDECYLSAAGSEALAESFGVNPRLVFNSALLRQLGLTLIAWNYPHVYRQALSTLHDPGQESYTPLDTAIHGILGFSPSMLGMRIVQLWGLSDTVSSIVGAGQENDNEGYPLLPRPEEGVPPADQAGLIAKLCTVGEAFARASKPQYYPSARADWEYAATVIAQHLGPDGTKILRQKADQLRRQFWDALPDMRLEHTAIVEEGRDAESGYVVSKYESNVFLRGCPADVQQKFWGLYRRLEPAVSQPLIRDFVHQLLPDLGFDVACVFTIDPLSERLVPVMRVGNPSFIRIKAVSLVESSAEMHPLRLALSNRIPTVEEGIVGNAVKRFVLGSIGGRKGVGVFYLEIAPLAEPRMQGHLPMLTQALQQCLNDLLLL
jgi:hypothetical protein